MCVIHGKHKNVSSFCNACQQQARYLREGYCLSRHCRFYFGRFSPKPSRTLVSKRYFGKGKGKDTNSRTSMFTWQRPVAKQRNKGTKRPLWRS